MTLLIAGGFTVALMSHYCRIAVALPSQSPPNHMALPWLCGGFGWLCPAFRGSKFGVGSSTFGVHHKDSGYDSPIPPPSGRSGVGPARVWGRSRGGLRWITQSCDIKQLTKLSTWLWVHPPQCCYGGRVRLCAPCIAGAGPAKARCRPGEAPMKCT